MLEQEDKKNKKQQEYLEEQERLQKLKERPPTPPPTKAEKEIAQVSSRWAHGIGVLHSVSTPHRLSLFVVCLVLLGPFPFSRAGG